MGALKEYVPSRRSAQLQSLRELLEDVGSPTVTVIEAQSLVRGHVASQSIDAVGLDIALDSSGLFDDIPATAPEAVEGKSLIIMELEFKVSDAWSAFGDERSGFAGPEGEGFARRGAIQGVILGAEGPGASRRHAAQAAARTADVQVHSSPAATREKRRLRNLGRRIGERTSKPEKQPSSGKVKDPPGQEKRVQEKAPRDYKRRHECNDKRCKFKEGDDILLGGPEGPLPRFWTVRAKGAWEVEVRHGGRGIRPVPGFKPDVHCPPVLNACGAQHIWRPGKVVVTAPRFSHIELDDGRLVSAPNDELNLKDVCQHRNSCPAEPPLMPHSDDWPPERREPCQGCEKLRTEGEFGHQWRKGLKPCCHCKVDRRGQCERSRVGRVNLGCGLEHQVAAGKGRAQQLRIQGGVTTAGRKDMAKMGHNGRAKQLKVAGVDKSACAVSITSVPRPRVAGGEVGQPRGKMRRLHAGAKNE